VRRIEQLRERAQQIVDGLLDEMVSAGGPADLVTSLALPLPVTLIAELLGVSPDDQGDFRDWSDAVLSTNSYSPEHVADSYGQLAAYIAGEVASRRKEPGDDLLSALVLARDGEEMLSEEELVVFGIVLLVAGYETTANQITNSVCTLLTNPGQADRIRERPELLPEAVEELLRAVPLGIVSMPVVAIADVELGGVLIRAGDPVMVARASANRDETVFPSADELDFEREANPHMAFGHGAHYCLGAQLARMELQVAIGSLLERFPDLRLAVPQDELAWKTGGLVRGLKSLPVTW
jgi:cytochrome P450